MKQPWEIFSHYKNLSRNSPTKLPVPGDSFRDLWRSPNNHLKGSINHPKRSPGLSPGLKGFTSYKYDSIDSTSLSILFLSFIHSFCVFPLFSLN